MENTFTLFLMELTLEPDVPKPFQVLFISLYTSQDVPFLHQIYDTCLPQGA